MILPLQEIPINGQIVALQAGTSLFASVFGFGDAIIAMPLLGLLFDLEATKAAPLVTLVSTLMISGNLALELNSGKLANVGRWTESAGLFAGAALGVPVGVHALVSVDPDLVRLALGLLLVAYGTRELTNQDDDPPIIDDALLPTLLRVLPFGFASGLLGGAVAEPGPPAVVFGQSQRWDPSTMRVMLFRFFLPVQLLALLDLNDAGLLTPPIVAQAAAAIPAVAGAVALGTLLNRQIDPDVFQGIIAALVLLLGLLASSSAASHLLPGLL